MTLTVGGGGGGGSINKNTAIVSGPGSAFAVHVLFQGFRQYFLSFFLFTNSAGPGLARQIQTYPTINFYLVEKPIKYFAL